MALKTWDCRWSNESKWWWQLLSIQAVAATSSNAHPWLRINVFFVGLVCLFVCFLVKRAVKCSICILKMSSRSKNINGLPLPLKRWVWTHYVAVS
jgi:hypothetical protein